jgi:alkylation response protein AidB-like acyl-CoA dehydrogenase
LAFAHDEPSARYDLAHVSTTARHHDGHWFLDGQKCLVLHGDTAGKFVVSARIRGEVGEQDGIALFLVDSDSPGISIDGYTTQDDRRAADVAFESVRVGPADIVGAPGEAYPIIERVCHEAIAALCAEAVGAMAALHEQTVAYLKQRRQFGMAIGSFQALQHRAADMFVALEQARSMTMFATIEASSNDAAARARATSAAKVQIGRSARLVGEQAVQLHGGIAMSMEYSAGHYFKRLTTIDRLLGDTDHHLRLVAQAGSLFERD